MIKKFVTFSTYLDNFYNDIKSENIGKHEYQNVITPIFYRYDQDILYISFQYYNFYIETKISKEKLEFLYNEYGNNLGGNQLDFYSWVYNTYLDNRGIQEA